jgi:hypothetical protein
MINERDSFNIELKELLSNLVAKNKIVCPVSPSILLEVRKQPNSDYRIKICHLMDKFSQGLSIRNWLTIFKEEFAYIIEGEKIEPQIAYSHFIESFSSGSRIVFENNVIDNNTNLIANSIFEHLDKMSIIDILNQAIDDEDKESITKLCTGLSELAQQEKEWRNKNLSSPANIEQMEFKSLVNVVLPQISSYLMDNTKSSFHEKLSNTSIDEKVEILNNCPTFFCQYKITAALRSNRSAIKENDLWDQEHIASALPYVDCFACDKATRHQCSNMLKLDEKYGTVIISNIKDLIKWLSTV